MMDEADGGLSVAVLMALHGVSREEAAQAFSDGQGHFDRAMRLLENQNTGACTTA